MALCDCHFFCALKYKQFLKITMIEIIMIAISISNLISLHTCKENLQKKKKKIQVKLEFMKK